jgi:hypothetical protein
MAWSRERGRTLRLQDTQRHGCRRGTLSEWLHPLPLGLRTAQDVGESRVFPHRRDSHTSPEIQKAIESFSYPRL